MATTATAELIADIEATVSRGSPQRAPTNAASVSFQCHGGSSVMRGENRKASRVELEHAQPVNLMGVDGTWRRSCQLLDISDTGARLVVEGPVNVLQAREFFLLLSSTGLAFRRCELVWIDGDQVGVRFVAKTPPKKKGKAASYKAAEPAPS